MKNREHESELMVEYPLYNKLQHRKITVEEISKLFRIYNITTIDELEAILHFTSVYKIENQNLQNLVNKLLDSTKSKYVIVENPKNKRKTIIFKKKASFKRIPTM